MPPDGPEEDKPPADTTAGDPGPAADAADNATDEVAGDAGHATDGPTITAPGIPAPQAGVIVPPPSTPAVTPASTPHTRVARAARCHGVTSVTPSRNQDARSME